MMTIRVITDDSTRQMKMTVWLVLVSERWLERRFPVKAPFLILVSVLVLDGKNVQTMPGMNQGAGWAQKFIGNDFPGIIFERP
jgi:hypothetical protein